MVLNTARMPLDACVKAICQLAERPNFRGDPAITSSALADKLLEAKIYSALSEHISLTMAPNGISVSVADGKVTLAGTCSKGAVPAKAEKAARGIAGVLERPRENSGARPRAGKVSRSERAPRCISKSPLVLNATIKILSSGKSFNISPRRTRRRLERLAESDEEICHDHHERVVLGGSRSAAGASDGRRIRQRSSETKRRRH
jgi:BON domain